MKNLAGNRKCDEEIRNELKIANIPIVSLGANVNSEVPYSIIGILNGFKFLRAWSYWVVIGDMPLKYAKEIYDNHKELQIRCAGHCGNVSPDEWCQPKGYEKACNELFKKYDSNEITLKEFHSEALKIREQGEQFIAYYHVDTQLGLCKLIDIIRQYNIVSELR